MSMNPINVSEALQDDRQARALIGLSLEAFNIILAAFIIDLKEAQSKNGKRKTKKRRQRKPGGGRKSAIGLPECQLFFILFYLKNYPTYDVLSFTFNISRSCACESVQRLLPVLIKTLKNLKVLPKRMSDPPEELTQLIESADKIMIDATERPIQRPKKEARQKKHFSGKKGYHTVKNTTISNDEKCVLILGKTAPGSQHDYSLLKEELNPETDWFANTKSYFDLGYQGVKNDYSSAENIHIPHKKPRKSKKNPDPQLTRQQKRENRQVGRVRVVVEHAIGGMKAFRVLTIRLRSHLTQLVDSFIFAVAGLWNLKNSFVVQ